MSAQNTWRLIFASSNGGVFIELTEVAFLDGAGNDLTVGGIASASSFYGAGYGAANAFDKSVANDWCSAAGAPFPHWLQYAHAAPVDVAQVRITCSSSSAWLPPSVEAIELRAGSSQQDKYSLSIASGSFAPGAVVLLNVTPYVAPTATLSPSAVYLSGGASAPAGPLLPPLATTHDLQDGGGYCIYGTTVLDGKPLDTLVRRRVQLYNQRDGRMIREVWSDDTTGDYSFGGIRGGDGTRYFVASFDHAQDKRAVIADGLVPEVMP